VNLTEKSPEAAARPSLRKSSKTKAAPSSSVAPPQEGAETWPQSPADKFFGVEPVIVLVNRSLERSLNAEPIVDETEDGEEDDSETPPRYKPHIILTKLSVQ
jgi:hypothetical protein